MVGKKPYKIGYIHKLDVKTQKNIHKMSFNRYLLMVRDEYFEAYTTTPSRSSIIIVAKPMTMSYSSQPQLKTIPMTTFGHSCPFPLL